MDDALYTESIIDCTWLSVLAKVLPVESKAKEKAYPGGTHLVAPVQIIFPEDQIVAVILGFLSFINTFWKKRII